MNKEAAGDDLGLTLQAGFVTKALVGLFGSDRFRLGVATLGAAGVEVAQQVLAETQSAVLPLVPYLDILRWVYIIVALGGIAVTIYARLDDWRRGRR